MRLGLAVPLGVLCAHPVGRCSHVSTRCINPAVRAESMNRSTVRYPEHCNNIEHLNLVFNDTWCRHRSHPACLKNERVRLW